MNGKLSKEWSDKELIEILVDWHKYAHGIGEIGYCYDDKCQVALVQIKARISQRSEPSKAELEEFVEKHYEKIRQAIGKSMFTLPIRLLHEMLSEYDELRRGK